MLDLNKPYINCQIVKNHVNTIKVKKKCCCYNKNNKLLTFVDEIGQVCSPFSFF